MDTHALSEPAFATAVEVLAGNGVEVMIDCDLGYTPTPAVSRAILCHNRGRSQGFADGIVITPSHNPPEDGGFKYNATNGGPADTDATRWIEQEANRLLGAGLRTVHRVTYEQALHAPTTFRYDYMGRYIDDLGAVVDMAAIRDSGLEIAADALERRRHSLLGRHRRTLPPAHEGPARPRRPHLPLHVGRLGRQDSHGLLLALRHGRADRVEGPIRAGVRLRYRP